MVVYYQAKTDEFAEMIFNKLCETAKLQLELAEEVQTIIEDNPGMSVDAALLLASD